MIAEASTPAQDRRQGITTCARGMERPEKDPSEKPDMMSMRLAPKVKGNCYHVSYTRHDVCRESGNSCIYRGGENLAGAFGLQGTSRLDTVRRSLGPCPTITTRSPV